LSSAVRNSGREFAAVLTVIVGAVAVPHLGRFFALISGDLVFAALFWDYPRGS